MLERSMIVDDDGASVGVVRGVLQSAGIGAVRVENELERALALGAPGSEPQLVITEVRLRGQSTQPLLRKLAARYPWVIVFGMSATATRAEVFALHRFGVSYFWDKPLEASQVAAALHDVRRRALPTPSTGALRELDLARLSAEYALTSAESHVLECALRHLTHKEISEERGVSANTVKSQVRSLLSKLGVSSLRELATQLERRSTRESGFFSTGPTSGSQRSGGAGRG